VAGLEVMALTDQNRISVVALVESALVGFAHETVGAVFVSRQVGRSTRIQYIIVDVVTDRIQKRRFDDRLSRYETSQFPGFT